MEKKQQNIYTEMESISWTDVERVWKSALDQLLLKLKRCDGKLKIFSTLFKILEVSCTKIAFYPQRITSMVWHAVNLVSGLPFAAILNALWFSFTHQTELNWTDPMRCDAIQTERNPTHFKFYLFEVCSVVLSVFSFNLINTTHLATGNSILLLWMFFFLILWNLRRCVHKTCSRFEILLTFCSRILTLCRVGFSLILVRGLFCRTYTKRTKTLSLSIG